MEFNGIPLHPLIVHVVVVLTPVAGLIAVAYAVPGWRWALRWPLVVTAVPGAAITYFATVTGHDLKDRLHLHGALIQTHETWAGRLEYAMWVLAVLALAAVFVLPYRNPVGSGTEHAGRAGVLRVPLSVVLALAGLAVLLLVFKTGDAGAHLVWDGTPK